MGEMVERVIGIMKTGEGLTIEALARHVILAMREPTTFMLVKGSDEFGKPKKTLPRAWQDMIDAALED